MDFLISVNAEIYLKGVKKSSTDGIPIKDDISLLINSITFREDADKFYSKYSIINNIKRKLNSFASSRYRGDIGSFARAAQESGVLEAYYDSVFMIVRKLRRLYKSCKEALHEEPSQCRKCELLHLGLNLHRDIPYLVETRYLLIEDDSLKRDRCSCDLRDISGSLRFPYIDTYENFFKMYGAQLNKKYGSKQDTRNFHKDRQNPAGITPDNLAKVEYNFWDNPLAEQSIKDAFFMFALPKNNDNYEENKKLKMLTSTELAKEYLSILDNYLMRETRNVMFEIDSALDSLKLITYDLEEAIYLWLLVEIMSHKNTAICKMCGNVFEPTRPNNLYCARHSRWQINYFNRCVNRMNAKLKEEQESKTE